jgi:hypothetical protein
MPIVDSYVVRVQKTHSPGRYAAGDVVHLSPKQFEAYQKDAPNGDRDAFRKLVTLMHIEQPDGSRKLVDEDGKPTGTVVPTERVRAENEIKSKIHELVRAEKLGADDEQRLCAKALGDSKLDVKAFLADPAGYFQGKQAAKK